MTSEVCDPRWRALLGEKWWCAGCKKRHDGPFDLACVSPEHWTGPEVLEPNGVVAESTHFLSEDFCVVENRDYFVRCVLEIPLIRSGGQSFGYGVWSTLSRKNFDLYREDFDEGLRGDAGPCFGWFSNRLKGYPETLNLKCQVNPRPNRQRPLVALHDADHPLGREQRDGIGFDRLVEIYSLHGHTLLSVKGG